MLKSILTAFIEAVYVYMVLVFPLAVLYRKAQRQETQNRRKQIKKR